MAPERPARHLRGDRRPQRRRGGPRDRPAHHPRRRRGARGPRRVLRPPARRARGVRPRRHAPRRADRGPARLRPGPAHHPHPRRPLHAGAVRGRAGARGRRGRRAGRHRRPPRPGLAVPRRGRGARREDRRPHDLPRLPRPALAQPARQGARQGPARPPRPRPAVLGHRPAPHRRRHAVRRRRRHGDEARAVGRRRSTRSPPTGPPSSSPPPAGSRSPRRSPASCPRASTWCSRADATRASTSASSTTPPPSARSGRSRWATTSSTGERSPRWPSPRRWCACSRASWATRSRCWRSRTRTGCWSTPSTPSPPAGAATTSPRCCCRATTAGSPRGATTRPYAAPPSAARTWWRPRRCPAASRSTSPPRRTRGRSTPCSAPAGCRSSRPTQASSSPPSTESLDDVAAGLEAHRTWVVRRAGRLVGSVRARLTSRGGWDIGRLMVAPDLQGQGLGRFLLEHAERAAPAEATTYLLFTGARSAANLRMYKKAGYRVRPDLEGAPGRRGADQARAPSGPDFAARARGLANSSLGLAGQTIAPTHAPGGSATNTCHRGCATPPASTARPPRSTIRFHGWPVALVRSKHDQRSQ